MQQANMCEMTYLAHSVLLDYAVLTPNAIWNAKRHPKLIKSQPLNQVPKRSAPTATMIE